MKYILVLFDNGININEFFNDEKNKGIFYINFVGQNFNYAENQSKYITVGNAMAKPIVKEENILFTITLVNGDSDYKDSRNYKVSLSDLFNLDSIYYKKLKSNYTSFINNDIKLEKDKFIKQNYALLYIFFGFKGDALFLHSYVNKNISSFVNQILRDNSEKVSISTHKIPIPNMITIKIDSKIFYDRFFITENYLININHSIYNNNDDDGSYNFFTFLSVLNEDVWKAYLNILDKLAKSKYEVICKCASIDTYYRRPNFKVEREHSSKIISTYSYPPLLP